MLGGVSEDEFRQAGLNPEAKSCLEDSRNYFATSRSGGAQSGPEARINVERLWGGRGYGVRNMGMSVDVLAVRGGGDR